MTLDDLRIELQKLNYEHFLMIKAFGKLPIGSSFPDIEVFVRQCDGTIKTPKISYDNEYGVIIE